MVAGRSRLVGNGLAPLFTVASDGNRTPDLLATRREAVYTHIDRTRNTLGQLALNWSRQLGGEGRAQALVYVRGTRRETVNGDASDAAGVIASLNGTSARQTAYGAAFSLAQRSGAHQWQVGVAADASRVRFGQTGQDATFDASRGVVPDAAVEPQLNAAVEGSALNLGAYATDTWKLAERTHLTITARANRARVSNKLTTVNGLTGDLEELPRETFNYSSLNPAIGVTQGLAAGLTAFANVARNTRVPTAIELGCADPANACRLPAGLQSDPFLKQVHSTSLELGSRWRENNEHRVELSLYRTDNRDDIVFASVSTTGQLGYFRNFARTRHQGLDVSWQGSIGEAELNASAGLLRATYEADGTLRMGGRNVVVTPGTRMAAIPKASLKVGGDWRVVAAWSFGVDLQWFGRRVVQGNEGGLIEDGGANRVDLSLPSYALTHLRASWRPSERWKSLEVMARVNNAFDKRYASYGAIASTLFDAQGNYTGVEREALFVAPGAPRSFFVGLRMKF